MESQERTAAVSASRRIKVNWNLTCTPNSIAIPGQLLSGVRIPRMRGTAERQALPPVFMRGEGHAVAGGVLRRSGESLLSHGFAVPAPPEGKPRALRTVLAPRIYEGGGPRSGGGSPPPQRREPSQSRFACQLSQRESQGGCAPFLPPHL